MKHWLMKSEPGECSIDDALAAPNATVPWVGVRNYQARNFMLRDMRVGDGVLFYHSSCAEPGVVGIARVASVAYPDATQFDPQSPYFDAGAKLRNRAAPQAPRWMLVDIQALSKIPTLSLLNMRAHPELADMLVLQRGNRLSITPVSPAHWQAIVGNLGNFGL